MTKYIRAANDDSYVQPPVPVEGPFPEILANIMYANQELEPWFRSSEVIEGVRAFDRIHNYLLTQEEGPFNELIAHFADHNPDLAGRLRTRGYYPHLKSYILMVKRNRERLKVTEPFPNQKENEEIRDFCTHTLEVKIADSILRFVHKHKNAWEK